MAEGGITVAEAVIKELLQNADDAGASEVSVILDERVPPKDLPTEYRPLLPAAIVVRNNKPFKLAEDVGSEKKDDFRALCEVASGHKWAQATAAGRFGIGFNSVYFLTDTPVIFSRREIHLFDLLHRVFSDNGWCFHLDDFPQSSPSLAGPVKNVVDWLFPSSALGLRHSIGSIANAADGDYRQAVVRLPLRNVDEGIPVLYSDRFPDERLRERVLNEMAQQARESLLFLKQVRKVTFERLDSEGCTSLYEAEVVETDAEFERFRQFIREVESRSHEGHETTMLECPFWRRTIVWRDRRSGSQRNWNFWVTHRADFQDSRLRELRDRLRRNDERATPWGALAIPADSESVDFAGDIPAWRVFLPLRETGPSKCLFSGAFFVGPSRQHVEYREVGSDEALRKTQWNQMLVERVLVPMLVNSTDKLPDLIPDLIRDNPEVYLSLFPAFKRAGLETSSLAQYFGSHFVNQPAILRLFDVWDDNKNFVEWMIGDDEPSITIEGIPEWLTSYRDAFRHLSDSRRRFVRRAIVQELLKRVPDGQKSKIKLDVFGDVLDSVLVYSVPPSARDLQKLLAELAKRKGTHLEPEDLDGRWCFARREDGQLRQYSPLALYLVSGEGTADGIYDILREPQQYGVEFADTEWVAHDVGLPSLPVDRRRHFANLVAEDKDGALQLLARVRNSRQDSVSQPELVTKIVTFLTEIPAKRLALLDFPLRLAFLVRTASLQHERRRFGVIMLKPEADSPEDEVIWEAIFRRTLAAVESQNARELHRLLSHYPDARDWLADEQCEVCAPTAANALSVLDQVLSRFPDFLEVFREAISRQDRERFVKPATAALIREAVRSWDRLSDSEQDTLLALPIHRTSEEQYVSLVGPGIGERNTLRERCRIQSKESDISDAPIKLEEYQLLDSGAESSAKRLYRDFLKLDEHNRVAVLKDVLRQIGSDPDRNSRMLEYLADHLRQTLNRLSASSDGAERRDAMEIKELLDRAKSIPCLDGTWRKPSECWDGSELARHLQGQGWSEDEASRLISMLFPDRSIAGLERKARELIRHVHGELEQRIDGWEIADRAVSSDSRDLTLHQRLKVLCDNWPPNRKATPAACVGQMTVPVISGTRVKLSEACLLPSSTRRLSGTGRDKFFPRAVELAAVVDEVGKTVHRDGVAEVDLEKLFSGLVELGATRISDGAAETTMIRDFAGIWVELGNDAERFDVLQDIDTFHLADKLADSAANLETVAVHRRKDRTTWIVAATAVSPKWLDTSPPLPPELCPTLASGKAAVQQVWDHWCGLNSFETVAERVVRIAKEQRGRTEQARAARTVYAWLERVRSKAMAQEDEYLGALKSLPWVFAVRGGNTDFRCPNDVFTGDGQALLSLDFWVPYQGQGLQLPDFCRRREVLRELGFGTSLPPTVDTVERLARCLEHSGESDLDVTMSVYRRVFNLIDEDAELKTKWLGLASERSVFRLFREPDIVVPRTKLFLGTKELGEDYGDLLYCARAGSSILGKEDFRLYRDLGVPDAPTIDQLFSAVSKINSRTESHRIAYRKLLGALSKHHEKLGNVPPETLRNVRVATCDGQFRRLGECYWNELLGLPEHLDGDSRRWLINAEDPETKSFVLSLAGQVPIAVQELTPVAAQSPDQTVPTAPAVTRLLGPWWEWCEELVRTDRVVHEEANKAGLSTDKKLEFSAVERIALQCQLQSGGIVRSSRDWLGPRVFSDGVNRIFIRADQLTEEMEANADELQKLDAEIREHVIQLLLRLEATCDADTAKADEFVSGRVER
jgi:hypothetical protein